MIFPAFFAYSTAAFVAVLPDLPSLIVNQNEKFYNFLSDHMEFPVLAALNLPLDFYKKKILYLRPIYYVQ